MKKKKREQITYGVAVVKYMQQYLEFTLTQQSISAESKSNMSGFSR